MTVKAPFISKSDIWRKVEEFRCRYPRCQRIPFDIDLLIEKDLGIEIVPETGPLQAAISIDFKSILVDAKQYWTPSYHCRVRYSLAHELGHYWLHREFLERNRPHNQDEWQSFIDLLPDNQYTFLEMHANEFAGVLLVPASELINRVSPLLQNGKRITYSDLARYFNVSSDVIEHRIKNDDVYPALREYLEP